MGVSLMNQWICIRSKKVRSNLFLRLRDCDSQYVQMKSILCLQVFQCYTCITDAIHNIIIESIHAIICSLVCLWDSVVASKCQWGTSNAWGPQVVLKQSSQRINPEVCFQRVWGPQGSDPPAFPYIAEAWVTASYLVHRHDSHVCQWMSIIVEMLGHRRFFSPPTSCTYDDPAM